MQSGNASPQPRDRPAAAPPPLENDSQVDGFRVKRLVAEGAMGEVYAAVDEQLGRRVALKFVKAALSDERAVRRFLDEARTTAQFNHPHIVTVYAVGTYQGRPYLALEYLDGETLRERLDRQGPVPPREAMRLARAVAEAVAEAHRHGIIHADLKPENVVLPKDGRVRVVDFGLSRFIGDGKPDFEGTPAYVAPELWTGAAPGPAVDVWALGILLHELVTGRRPLSAEQLAKLAYHPHPVELGAGAEHAECAELLRACLCVKPDERPAAEEVAASLSSLLEAREAAKEPAVRSPFRGLQAFSEADSSDFHGRAAEVDAVAEKLRTAGLVPIVGPSGVGKSSFVYAGLAPRLRDADRWTVISCRPGRRPLWSLASALAAHTGAKDLEVVAKRLGEHPGTLGVTLRVLARDSGTRLLLFVDQFEESYTLSSAAEAAKLCACLAAAASAEDPWRIVLAMRDDFLNVFAANEAMRPALGAVTVLGPLGQAALEEAVAGPLRRVGFHADVPQLPARIASELHGQPAALPLLQFACQALWDRRDAARKLVLQSEYDAMGGATGALAEHAQKVLSGLGSEERALVRALMLKLVHTDGTRWPRTRAELLDGLPEDGARVLERLLERRLLVASAQAETGEPLVELAHESLVTTWPTLGRWLSETHEERALVEDLERAAALWAKRGRPDTETWSGKELAKAVEGLDAWNVRLATVPREFLDAARQREARTRRRRLGLLGGGVGLLAVVAVAAVVTAIVFEQRERVAIAQQEQIRIASADLGEFELVLAPFDWDAQALRAVPVSAATLPRLDWRIHAPDPEDQRKAGRLYGEGDVVVHEPHLGADGELHQLVEARSGPVFLEVTGRGDCRSASWVFLQRLPGYSERARRGQIRIPVPTCQATRSDTIEIPAGPFLETVLVGEAGQDVERSLPAFAIDRTEVTAGQFDVYAALERHTGDTRGQIPPLMAKESPSLPATGLNAWTAERFCQFFGKRLPTLAEWQKAARGGLTLDAEGKVVNPQPARLTPWGGPFPFKAGLANLEGAEDGFGYMAPVGSFPTDRSPYGLLDVAGNQSEWTSSLPPRATLNGLRTVVGGNWSIPLGIPLLRLDASNSRPAASFDFTVGVRCAVQSDT